MISLAAWMTVSTSALSKLSDDEAAALGGGTGGAVGGCGIGGGAWAPRPAARASRCAAHRRRARGVGRGSGPGGGKRQCDRRRRRRRLGSTSRTRRPARAGREDCDEALHASSEARAAAGCWGRPALPGTGARGSATVGERRGARKARRCLPGWHRLRSGRRHARRRSENAGELGCGIGVGG